MSINVTSAKHLLLPENSFFFEISIGLLLQKFFETHNQSINVTQYKAPHKPHRPNLKHLTLNIQTQITPPSTILFPKAKVQNLTQTTKSISSSLHTKSNSNTQPNSHTTILEATHRICRTHRVASHSQSQDSKTLLHWMEMGPSLKREEIRTSELLVVRE
jgi:hypothetical protein